MCNFCKKFNAEICSAYCLMTKEQKRQHVEKLLAEVKANKEVRRSVSWLFALFLSVFIALFREQFVHVQIRQP